MASERRYTSTRRAQQAAATRQDVIAAGIELFAESGWAGTTIAALAERAGVAVETIYAGFGSKRGVLRAAMDAAVVGDADPIPLVDRPEFARLQEGSLEERVAACAKLVTDIHRRSAGVWRAIVEAASAEAEVAAWRDELEANRRVDVGAQPRADARSAFDGTPARPGLGAARPGDLPQARCRCGHVAKGLRTLHGRRDRRARDDRWDGGTLSIAAVRLAHAATRTRTRGYDPANRDGLGGGQLGDRVRWAQPRQPAALRSDRARAEDRQESDGVGVAAADRLPEGRGPAGARSVAAAPGTPSGP